MRVHHGFMVAACVWMGAACGGGQSTDGSADLVTRPMDGLIDRTVAPPPGDPRPFALPGVTETTLDNGLRVVVVERPSFPTIALRLTVRAGHDATDGRPEVAELTTRVLRDGADRSDAAAIARRLDVLGMRYTAATQPNRVVLAMDGLATSAREASALLANLARRPHLDPERIEARRDEYADELEVNAAQPSFHRQRLMRRVLFGDHVYGQTASPDAVRAVTADEVRAHHASTWGPNRATLYIVGAIDDDALDAILANFAGWDATTEPWAAPEPPVVTTCNEAHVVVRPDSAQTSVAWVGPSPTRDDDGWFDALVANQVVGGGPSARLFMHLREERSYTYGAYSRPMHYAGLSIITSTSDVRGDVTHQALDAFVEEWDRAHNETIPDNELTDARDYLSGILPIELERNGPLAGYVSDLVDSELGVAFLDGYRDAVAGVTAEGASAAAADLFGRDDLTLIMVGEREVAIPAAQAHASVVHVYDLDGALVETLDGALDSTCPTPFVR